MGINFPSSPGDGQIFNVSPGLSFVYRNSRWAPAPLKTALPKNYVVNPAMQVSQEYGAASIATANQYLADEWLGVWTSGAQSMAQVVGYPNAIRLWCGALVATPAAGDAAYFRHRMEGARVADFRWGTVNAKQAVLRFKAGITSGAVPYTFSVGFRTPDPAPFLSYVKNFTITVASLLQDFTMVIPGPTTGTWPVGSGGGMDIYVTPMCGANLTTPSPEAWVVGNFIATTGISNLYNTINRGIDIADVGLYLDPYLTGVAPPFVMPWLGAEYRRCQRYWYRGFGFQGVVNLATGIRGGMRHPTVMRATPTMAIRGTPRLYDLAATPLIDSLSTANNEYVADLQIYASAGGLVAGRTGVNYWQGADQYIAMNARM